MIEENVQEQEEFPESKPAEKDGAENVFDFARIARSICARNGRKRADAAGLLCGGAYDGDHTRYVRGAL